MLFDYFLIAVRNLKRQRTRTWLTMIGIFIGVAAIVSLVSLGQGLQVAINEQFEELGADKIIISPGSSSALTSMSSTSGLSNLDIHSVRKVNGVKDAAGISYGIAGVKFQGKVKFGWISGLPTDNSKRIVESMQSVEIIEGRELRQADRYKALVGREFYSGRYFGEKVNLGDKLLIGNKSFKVVGKFGPIGNPDDDSTVWMPLKTAQELMGKPNQVNMIIAQTNPGEDVDEVAKRIKHALRRSRHVKKGQEDFSVSTTEQLLETFSTILDAVRIVFVGIASISLIVGGIGIMNTMYTSVLERTSEIGVMKAIGARNIDIAAIFLIESGLLGMIGGAVGILMGVLLSTGIEKIMSASMGMEYLRAFFPMSLMLGSLAFSFLVGSLSGVLPAIKASRLKPAEALRWE